MTLHGYGVRFVPRVSRDPEWHPAMGTRRKVKQEEALFDPGPPVRSKERKQRWRK